MGQSQDPRAEETEERGGLDGRRAGDRLQQPVAKRYTQRPDPCVNRASVDTQNRLDEVAGLDRDELTGYRRSRGCVLETRKEASHGTSCDRSRWKGISNLRAEQRRPDRGRAAVSDRGAAGVSGEPSPESRRGRDVQRSIWNGGCGAVGWPRGARRTLDPSAGTPRRGTPAGKRPSRCAGAPRGVVPPPS